MLIKNKSLATPIALNSFNPNDFIVIDLRSRGYFLISHIQDALNIESLQRIAHITKKKKNKKILIYYHSEATAADFGSQLVEMGFHNIYYVDDNFFSLKKHNITMDGEGMQ